MPHSMNVLCTVTVSRGPYHNAINASCHATCPGNLCAYGSASASVAVADHISHDILAFTYITMPAHILQ